MHELRTRERRDQGFTLMELMVVMVIAASLMGLGAGLFTSMGKRTATEAALSNLQSLIVNVRNASSRFPSMIAVDPDLGEVQGLAQEVRQELHFDPRPTNEATNASAPVARGIEGRDCDFGGATVDATAGRVGGGLKLGGQRVNCNSYPAYDVTDGVTVEFWMKPDASFAGDVVTKGDAIKVRVESGGRIAATVGVKADHGVDRVASSAQIPAVRPGQWLGVKVTYDRSALVLYTDNGFGWVPRGLPKLETRKMVVSNEPLTVGGFSGILDDFQFAGVHSTEPLVVPPTVKILGKKPYEPIHFVGGRLDPAVHLVPRSISLESQGRRTTLEIALNGTLSVSYADVATAPPTNEKGEPVPEKRKKE
jgi:prepilin-type N-terminal cleavage/methylation domain-containing protein